MKLKEKSLGNRKNEIESIVTGSTDLKQEGVSDSIADEAENKTVDMAFNFDADQVNKIMEDIFKISLTDQSQQNKVITPGYILKSDQEAVWLYSVTRKTFLKVNSNSEISSLDMINDDMTYCVINNDIYEVKNEMIYCVGWN